MEQYFTTIAENEFKKDLFLHPLAYSIKPYQSMTDCLSTIISPIILPGYFLTLAIFSLIESILSTMYLCYLIISKSDTTQDITDHTSPAKIGFQMLCACLIIAPLMMVVFFLRLASTFIFEIVDSFDDPLEKKRSALKEKKLISEAISNYATLIVKVNVDKRKILEIFHSYKSESNLFVGDTTQKQYSDKKHHDIATHSYFQTNDDLLNLVRDKDKNNEMLSTLQELIVSYPNDSFEQYVKLEEVELAFAVLEEHHIKVLNLVDVLFPSMFGFLNEAKQVSKSSSLLSRGIINA